jgi:pyruvate/2-oxoglutarate dehydrogenase complex dihydrolipoamide acyltransferase (E2) component
VEVLMPKLGLTMSEGTVTAWLVAEGSKVSVGQAICEIETDKVTEEILAEDDGVLRQLVPVGTVVTAGDAIGVIG